MTTSAFTQPLLKGAVDCHFHILSPEYPEATEDAYQRLSQQLGLEKGIIVQASTQGKSPKRILEAKSCLGPNYRILGEIDLRLSDSDLNQLANQQMVGSRVNYKSKEPLDWRDIEAYARRIEKWGWHLDFYISSEMFQAWAKKMEGLPIPMVLDHFAMHQAKDSPSALLKLIDRGNTWVKLSAPYRISKKPLPYSDIEPLARMLIQHAPERMLWGTDWPHMRIEGPMPNDSDLWKLIQIWSGSKAKQILVENPTLFYQFN
jgi:predicted TIM-barrel fold metal-dependent hydrolase